MKIEACPHGWFGGHKFEPRYDLGAAQELKGLRVEGLQAIKVAAEAMRSETYVRDICVRCGETVEREK